MALTKFSQRNLYVIENFIDNYTSDEEEREQMKQVAWDYVSEDHVDGEGSEEASLERAEAGKLVYVMPTQLDYDLVDLVESSEEEFKLLAKKEGRVYDLEGFQEAFLKNEISPDLDYIRIL